METIESGGLSAEEGRDTRERRKGRDNLKLNYTYYNSQAEENDPSFDEPTMFQSYYFI